MSRSIQVGDVVRYNQRPRAARPEVSWYSNGAGGLGMVASTHEPLVGVRWEGQREVRWVHRASLEVVYLLNPHTDLAHLQREPLTEAQRVLADWLTEQGCPACAHAMRWRPERRERVLRALAKRGGEALGLAVACGYKAPGYFLGADYGSDGAVVIELRDEHGRILVQERTKPEVAVVAMRKNLVDISVNVTPFVEALNTVQEAMARIFGLPPAMLRPPRATPR